MAASAKRDIQIWRPQPDFVEQSSSDIWRAVCASVKEAVKLANLKPADISGIAFDATCSLVAVDAAGKPVSLSPSGNDNQNIIVWMDHRATGEAVKLTAGGHRVIRYLGGVVSPEHEIPKLVWVRKNLPESYARAARFFDLADWLAFHCTGADIRSLCTTVCKWTCMGHEHSPDKRWVRDFFQSNGIGDLLSKNKIGRDIRPMGEKSGGLQAAAARELGLLAGTAVAVGIIDAHAGGLGVFGLAKGRFNEAFALIGGTSSCHMAVSRRPRFVHGVWGPYYSAMIPGWWLQRRRPKRHRRWIL